MTSGLVLIFNVLYSYMIVVSIYLAGGIRNLNAIQKLLYGQCYFVVSSGILESLVSQLYYIVPMPVWVLKRNQMLQAVYNASEAAKPLIQF